MKLPAILGNALALLILTASCPSLGADAHPFIDAGSSRCVWMDHPVLQLNGHAQWLAGAPLQVAWTKTVGPGIVTFGTPNAMATTARFDAAGVYELQMYVKDSAGSHMGRLTVEVYDPSQPLLIPDVKKPMKQDFGYPPDVRQKYFTSDLGLTYNFSGIDWDHLRPAPAPYVHPRILINAEEKPDLQRRLKTTKVGQIEMNTIRETVQRELTGQTATNRALYDALASGSMDAIASAPTGKRSTTCALITYEIFRAYVEDDKLGGAKAVAALDTLAKVGLAVVEKNPSNDWRNKNSDPCYHQFLGLGYDFGYNFMTDAQRTSIRKTLAVATTNAWGIGMNALPALNANSSNWIVNNALYLVIDNLAVEGETGWDVNSYLRVEAALERFCMMGIDPDGALYEGMGKGQVNAEMLVALAKRGSMLIASNSIRNHARQFYLNCMETTGYGFTWDELLGTNFQTSKYADVPAVKYAFANDPIIDFVFRNDVGSPKGDFTRQLGLSKINLGFIFQTPDNLTRAIFALDPDTSKSWDDQAAALDATMPKSCFFNNRGLMITRSSWNKDGLKLTFQPRSNPGGHSMDDRNYFGLSALGRIWAPYTAEHHEGSDPSTVASVVRVDDVGPSILATRAVQYSDTDLFTYAVGDAKIPYSKSPANEKDGSIQSYTFNQNRLKPTSEPWADMPWGDLPEWYSSYAGHAYWKDHTPVLKAFRTAGLIRGASPYALIVDDIQKDTSRHDYTWRMLLANDLKVTVSGSDTVLEDTVSNKRLLVRILNCNGTPEIAQHEINWVLPKGEKRTRPVLDIKVNTVSPDFRILLFPYTSDAALPTTTSVNNITTIKTASGQTDRLTFTPSPDGRTRIQLNRL